MVFILHYFRAFILITNESESGLLQYIEETFYMFRDSCLAFTVSGDRRSLQLPSNCEPLSSNAGLSLRGIKGHGEVIFQRRSLNLFPLREVQKVCSLRPAEADSLLLMAGRLAEAGFIWQVASFGGGQQQQQRICSRPGRQSRIGNLSKTEYARPICLLMRFTKMPSPIYWAS